MRTPKVKFSRSVPGADRIHYVGEEDVLVVLGRLPVELWHRLRAVHFNDQSRGARILGYVSRGRRDIALCAQPPRMSLTRALVRGQTPEMFGAKKGQKWPMIAVRRFILYEVFLHEVGHMQLSEKEPPSSRLGFAREKLAQDFALHGVSSYGRSRSRIPTRFIILLRPKNLGELLRTPCGTSYESVPDNPALKRWVIRACFAVEHYRLR